MELTPKDYEQMPIRLTKQNLYNAPRIILRLFGIHGIRSKVHTFRRWLSQGLGNITALFGFRVIQLKYNPAITERRLYQNYLSRNIFTTIFDVGANIGQTSAGFSQQFPEAGIFSFEPYFENFDTLTANMRSFSKVRCFHLALSSSNGSLRVLRDGHHLSQWNSLEDAFQKELCDRADSKEEEIHLETGDRFCEQQGIKHIDILKTDTEGHDLSVLSGFKRMFEASAIDSVVIECGFLKDASHTSLEGACNFLDIYGMQLAGCYDVSYLETGGCEYFNALFIKR